MICRVTLLLLIVRDDMIKDVLRIGDMPYSDLCAAWHTHHANDMHSMTQLKGCLAHTGERWCRDECMCVGEDMHQRMFRTCSCNPFLSTIARADINDAASTSVPSICQPYERCAMMGKIQEAPQPMSRPWRGMLDVDVDAAVDVGADVDVDVDVDADVAVAVAEMSSSTPSRSATQCM